MKQGEKGRSMVEMLGVLAIIGVLSVGGLLGYSVGMKKYKINKLANNANLLLVRVLTAFEGQNDFSGLIENNYAHNETLMKNLGVYEGDENPFGAVVFESGAAGRYVGLFFNYLPKDACVHMLTNDIFNVGVNVNVHVNNGGVIPEYPASIDDASTWCLANPTPDLNIVHFFFEKSE